jgi:hypothetical protein
MSAGFGRTLLLFLHFHRRRPEIREESSMMLFLAMRMA